MTTVADKMYSEKSITFINDTILNTVSKRLASERAISESKANSFFYGILKQKIPDQTTN